MRSRRVIMLAHNRVEISHAVTSHDWKPCLKILNKKSKGSNSTKILLSTVNLSIEMRFLIKLGAWMTLLKERGGKGLGKIVCSQP